MAYVLIDRQLDLGVNNARRSAFDSSNHQRYLLGKATTTGLHDTNAFSREQPSQLYVD